LGLHFLSNTAGLIIRQTYTQSVIIDRNVKKKRQVNDKFNCLAFRTKTNKNRLSVKSGTKKINRNPLPFTSF